jgi:hypothetical protein
VYVLDLRLVPCGILFVLLLGRGRSPDRPPGRNIELQVLLLWTYTQSLIRSLNTHAEIVSAKLESSTSSVSNVDSGVYQESNDAAGMNYSPTYVQNAISRQTHQQQILEQSYIQHSRNLELYLRPFQTSYSSLPQTLQELLVDIEPLKSQVTIPSRWLHALEIR